ncbi:hypothetical protein GCM10010977_01710 [Citricoccus zhacaiensis]|uniref:DUF2550 family protein n=1 Tax=Citricoccus zhacaiensis TaxID=489142 RepID=A0ABQ2LLZ1_9MICC|nr:DUF2550 family protein [Citricoccus zhacaiensis]GGO40055.1 hypothetical protein GCM10010977_01710 [Citricoccus zhacaiensis]
MTPGWSALIAAVLAALVAAVLVVAFMVYWRWRTLVRTPGTFTARIRGAGEGTGGVRVIGRYDESGLDLMTVASVDPRPRWSAARHMLRLHREGAVRQDGSVVVRVDGGPAPVDLVIQADACAGLSAWIESGPAVGFGTWRELPPRGYRRRAH